MTDPTYEDCDEDGNPQAQSKRPAWMSTAGVDYQNLLQEAFYVCSGGARKYFASPWEHKTWKQICKKLDKGKMSIAWVESQIEIARERNRFRICIVFGQLEHMIINIERQKDWEAKNRIAEGFLHDITEEESDDLSD